MVCENVDLAKVKTEAVKHGFDWKMTLAGIQKESMTLGSFKVMADVNKHEILAGAQVIGLLPWC